jgi:sugar/nucleoside kinase (ribokinase family)
MIVNGSQDDCHLIDNNQKVFDKDFDLLQIDQYERHFIEQNYENIKSFDGTIVLDGGSWKDWSTDFLRLADIPIVSEVFLKDGLGHFAEMCHEIGLSRWAVTRGINGVIWQDGTASGEIPAVGVDTIDTLGAGDVFHGAFCYYYANTGNFVQSLERANKIAANSCKSAGTRSWMSA